MRGDDDEGGMDMAALFGRPSDSDAGGPDEDFRDLCRTIFPADTDGAKCEALFEAIQSLLGKETAAEDEGADEEG